MTHENIVGFFKQKLKKDLKKLSTIKVKRTGERKAAFVQGTQGVTGASFKLDGYTVSFKFKEPLSTQRQLKTSSKRMEKSIKRNAEAIKRLALLNALSLELKNFDKEFKKKIKKTLQTRSKTMHQKIRSFSQSSLITSSAITLVMAKAGSQPKLPGAFVVSLGEEGYSFILRDDDNTVLLNSEKVYTTLDELYDDLSGLRKYALNDKMYDFETYGGYYFRIYDGSDEAIASNDSFLSEAEMIAAIARIKEIIGNAPVLEHLA